jgi:23S rRNA (uracil1939-C5)-methyltransferase
VVARVGGEEVLVTLVARRDPGGDFASLLRQLREKVPALCSLQLNVNTRKSPVVLGPRSRVLWGKGFLDERFMGLSFRLSPGSFFQVNPAQAEVLYSRVLSFLGRPGAPVVDAYCGVGALSLLLAARGHEVAGIEVSFEAVADARAAAQDNRLEAGFHQGKVERVLPRLLATGFRPAAVVLDPPRRGCEAEVLSALAASRIGRIAYLSCHPGTLARDLTRLLAHGYRLETIEGVDMFPQTAHLEVFAGLVRG